MHLDQLRGQVREQREARGMTQAELAEDAGVGRQWLVGFESGKMANPKWDSLAAILGVLGLELTLSQRRKAVPATNSLNEILDRLNEEARAALPAGWPQFDSPLVPEPIRQATDVSDYDTLPVAESAG